MTFFEAWYHLQTSHCSTDDGSTLVFGPQTRRACETRVCVGGRFVSLSLSTANGGYQNWLYLFQVLVSGIFFWRGKMCGGGVGGHVPFSPRCVCFFFLWTFSLCVFLVTCDAGTRLYIIAIQQANLHGNGYIYIYMDVVSTIMINHHLGNMRTFSKHNGQANLRFYSRTGMFVKKSPTQKTHFNLFSFEGQVFWRNLKLKKHQFFSPLEDFGISRRQSLRIHGTKQWIFFSTYEFTPWKINDWNLKAT